MSEWKEFLLGDVATIKGGKRLPNGSDLVNFKTNHPYIRTRDINNNKIAINDLLFVPDDVFPKISRYIVEENDIIVSIVGTIGLCAIVPRALHLASLTENCAKIVNLNSNVVDWRYLYYYLISSNGQDELHKRNVGSTQPKLPLYNIKSIPLLLPPLPEQRAIASVLSSLDDKIDLLHRQNKTLEAMAEALFRQWFVEPCKDGLPEGWREGKLGDVVTITSGKGLKKEQFKDDGYYPVLGANGIIGRTDNYISDEKVLYTGRVGTLGKIYIVNNQKVWFSDNTLVIKPGKFFYLIYFILKNAKLEEYNVGSTQPLIRQSDLKEIDIIHVNQEHGEHYESCAKLYFDKIQRNQDCINILEKIRDSLLPKLMSGEVRVSL